MARGLREGQSGRRAHRTPRPRLVMGDRGKAPMACGLEHPSLGEDSAHVLCLVPIEQLGMMPTATLLGRRRASGHCSYPRSGPGLRRSGAFGMSTDGVSNMDRAEVHLGQGGNPRMRAATSG
jgi:hypothetical protein